MARARRLRTVERGGQTYFDKAELDAFDRHLHQPWAPKGTRRPKVPAWIEVHLRAESGNRCLRCGRGAGVETVHIEAWQRSRSHHHDNLVRVCSGCHDEHDRHGSLSTDELRKVKEKGKRRTRASLEREASRFDPPASARTFVGRREDLTDLCGALERSRAVLIRGPGGIGKTELLLRALEKMKLGRPVIWLGVEGYRTAGDIQVALALAVAEAEGRGSMESVAKGLEAQGACVVLDGVERMVDTDLDDLDDLVAALQARLRKAQLVLTSQVDLPGTPFDQRFVLSGLDAMSSRALLRSLVGGDARLDAASASGLLAFAEGHALTLRLIASLVRHLGSGRSALREVRRAGAGVVELPKRAKQNRETSLDRCLALAYEMLGRNERRALYAVASCPGGVSADHLEHLLGETAPTLTAALRRWSLAQARDIGTPLERWYVLTPIGSFARRRWSSANESEAEELKAELLWDFGVMAAAIESHTQRKEDIPHMVGRLWEEWPNLLLVVEAAEARPDDCDLAMLASAVCSAMVHFLFVARLPEQGVGLLARRAQMAMRAGKWGDASGHLAEVAALATRNDGDRTMAAVEALLEEIPAGRSETTGSVGVARAILAEQRGDAHGMEKGARTAIAYYHGVLDQLPRRPDSVEAEKLAGTRNELSAAYQLLGTALLMLRRPKDASQAYETSLKLVSGAAAAVNEGQIVYQIGRCRVAVGEHMEAAGCFSQAAEHFQGIGMKGYLSNAAGGLGYALLELDDASPLPSALPSAVLRDGIEDAFEDAQRWVFTAGRKGATNDEWPIIKLLGVIAALSLSDEAARLGEVGRRVLKWAKDVLEGGDQTAATAHDATYELMHLVGLANLMMSIGQLEGRATATEGPGEKDIAELARRCGSVGMVRGLESSAFQWCSLYLWRRWSVR